MNPKRKCNICGTVLVKIRDFIKQSGYSYYLECPKCSKKKDLPINTYTINLTPSGDNMDGLEK